MSGAPTPQGGGPCVSIVLWDLRRSQATVESLREYLRDYAVEAYGELEGMRLKAWISDAERQLWGAVYLWDGPEHLPGLYAVSRVVELIGYPPTSVGGFALEAVAEGRSAHAVLAGLGAAFAVEESPGG